MCDHCRSARQGHGMTGVQEKAVAFAKSIENPSGTNSRIHRSENSIADETCCMKWKKTCCGGGCCDSMISNSPCCGMRQPAGTIRQSQPPQYRKSMYRPDNVGGPSGYPQSGQPDCRSDYNCNAGYVTNAMTVPCGVEGSTSGMGVCPAMMRNLPCTPIIEPKCFGGDCRDDDTDSENSRQI